MINLFQFASNDASCGDLITIFGTMNGVVCNTPGGASNAALSAMFQTFNSVVLAVAVLVLVYVTVVGVMATAHEGEFMGKKWNNIWIPIRAVLGIAALVPLGGGGYSLIQYAMMWVIVQGIGAADTLWTTALNAISTQGSLFAQPTVSPAATSSNLSTLFQALTCDATARRNDANPSTDSNSNYWCQDNPKDPVCRPFAFNTTSATCTNDTCTFNLGPEKGDCGVLSYCNKSTACAGNDSSNQPNSASMKCAACTAQTDALGTIVPVLAGIAAKFAQLDYDYRWFYNMSFTSPVSTYPDWSFIAAYCTANGIDTCCIPGHGTFTQPETCQAKTNNSSSSTSSPSAYQSGQTSYGLFDENNTQTKSNQNPSDGAVQSLYAPAIVQAYPANNGDFIDTAISEYTTQIQTATTAWTNAQNTSKTQMSDKLSDAQSKGWIYAGGLYYTIAGMNDNNLQDASPAFKVTGGPAKNSMNNYRNNYTAAQTLMNTVNGSSGSPLNDSSIGGTGAAVGNTMSGVNQAFMQNISGSGGSNPLAQLQATGMALIISAEILFVLFLTMTILLAVFGYIDFEVLGTGGLDPEGPAMVIIYMVVVPLVFGLIGIMISLGGTLAVYVPLIPYIIFTFGAVGWLLAVIEALVAGPLVALGIISPSGQHELLGKAEPALMLLFNVFLRPSLMIFGLIAAIFLASVVTGMINATFKAAVSNMSGTGSGAKTGAWGDPLTSILFLCAYVMIIVAALNKCFSAISIVPQQVLSWIGGQGQPGGAAGDAGEALQEAKGGVAAGGGRATGAMTSDSGAKGQEAAYKKGKGITSAQLGAKTMAKKDEPPAGGNAPP